MKLLRTFLISWLVVNAIAIAFPRHPATDQILHNQNSSVDAAGDPLLESEGVATAADDPAEWTQAVARGAKLLQGMKGSDAEAAALYGMRTAESPFDGDCREDFKTWGYNENDMLNAKIDQECDFARYHKIGKTMQELGMDTKSKGNRGQNRCYVVNHWDGPAVKKVLGILPFPWEQKYEVCKTEYRVRHTHMPEKH